MTRDSEYLYTMSQIAAGPPPAHYLVIDLEATCDEQHRIPRDETEIIEIGAVLVDGASLVVVDSWQTFVRPSMHPRLTPFCTKLTSISQAEVATAATFPAALAALHAFIAGRELLFSSWGDYDRAQIARECARHDLPMPFAAHFNIKTAFNARVGDGKTRGVGQALRHLRWSFEGTAHRGIDDARNIARLLPFALGRQAE